MKSIKGLKMKFIYLMWIVLIESDLFVNDVTGCLESHDIYKHVIKNLESYQVATFITENITKNCNQSISALHEFPRVTLQLKQDGVQMSSNMKRRVQRPLHGSLMVLYASDVDSVKTFIGFLIKLSGTKMRPKCLVFFSSNQLTFKNVIKRMLKYAWERKFLDFAIIASAAEYDAENSTPKVYNFNPFFDTVNENLFDTQVNVFPEKLKDANQYPIYLPSSKESEFPVYINLANGRLHIEHEGNLIAQFTLRSLNFDIRFKNGSNDANDFGSFEMITDLWPVYIWSFFFTGDNIISSEGKFMSIVAMVPDLPSIPVDVSLKMISTPLLRSLFVLICIYLLKYVKLAKEFKDRFSMITTLLGQFVKDEPKKVVGRIVFTTLVMAYVFIMNDFYSDFIEVKYTEVEIDGYKSLYESNFVVFTDIYETHGLLIDYHENSYLKKLVPKIRFEEDIDNCVNKLLKSKSVICITFYKNAIVHYNFHRDSNGLPVMRIARPDLFAFGSVYLFFDGSPYVEKFAKTQRRIRESGLDYGLLLMNKNRRKMPNGVEPEPVAEQKKLAKQLLTILIIGCSISFAAFIIELLTVQKKLIMKWFSFKSLKSKYNKIRNKLF